MKTAHDPLPTGQLERENKAEIDRDWSREKQEKRLRPSGRPLGRMALWLLFSTKVLWGVGVWLKDAGRRLQESPTSHVIAGIGNPIRLTGAQSRLRNAEAIRETYANRGQIAEVYANLGCLGMTPAEPYANLG